MSKITTVYCDLDSVLVDFERGLLKYANKLLNAVAKEPGHSLEKTAKKAVIELGGAWPSSVPEICAPHIVRRSAKFPKVRDFCFRAVENNIKFWSRLPWMSDGKDLWAFLRTIRQEVIILTAPLDAMSHVGKRSWVRKHLGAHVQVIVKMDKSVYATPTCLLIDDSDFQVDPFIGDGGQAILHTDSVSTIRKLKQVLA